jgi:beta-glucuronidase
MSHLAAKARELDGTRPISAACLISNEKLARMLDNSKPSKPVIVSEFGGDARLGERGSVDRCLPLHQGGDSVDSLRLSLPAPSQSLSRTLQPQGGIDADRKTKEPAFFVMAVFYKTIDR